MTARYSQPSLVQMSLKAFPVYVGSPIPCHAFGALGTLAIPLLQRKLETLYITSPFLVRAIRSDILIQQVGRDVERMVAICCGLVFLGPDDLDAVLAHQTAHTPVTDVQPQLLQLFGHPWPSIALQAEPMLLTDVGEKGHIITLSLAHWAHPPSTEPA